LEYRGDAAPLSAPPVLNPYTRLTAVMIPRHGILRVTGYEVTNADLPRPVTEVYLAGRSEPDALADLVCEYDNVGYAPMIRQCTDADVAAIDAIINEAAQAYRGVIPIDCWHEPYMSRPDLLAEIGAGVAFSGWDEAGSLVGVMGLQRVRDVTLIRHAYVRPEYQGHGIGGALLAALAAQATGPLSVGTWAAAEWAIRFYVQHGFRQVSATEKDRLLETYWRVSRRQRETSVVLTR
jgi:N-acetylglutamate synthase-like GNAT family acetyltransferase